MSERQDVEAAAREIIGLDWKPSRAAGEDADVCNADT